MNNVDHLKPYFHVITVVSNPVRYESRYRLYRWFARRMAKAGANLITVELQNGCRDFVITSKHNPNHLQLRTEDELWHKENLINLGVGHLNRIHPDWKYVAWIDADVTFQRKNWLTETIHELQVAHWVQMFQQAIDMGPCGEALHIHQGFINSYLQGLPYRSGYCNWHPGYAWACTREAFVEVGGLLDKAILGSGDRHMALAVIGKAEVSYNHHVTQHYKEMVLHWQCRAERYIKRDVGFVKGTIFHAWHGRKAKRGYQDRWQILVKNKYDPFVDVYYDHQGVLRLEGDRIQLRDDIKRYFRSRFEDENTLD